MTSPAFIDGTDLAAWADRLDAQSRLPELIRRLVLATTRDVSQIHFRSGEGVQLGEWDGTVDVQVGNAFVPAGMSGWEMGTNCGQKAKADHDYAERVANPLGLDPARTTFIFVTPRRWGRKGSWVREKTQKGEWQGVRAYDADDLMTWLHLAPAVHAWISTLRGKDPVVCQDLESYWTQWHQATSPPFEADLVISGREAEATRLLQQFTMPAGALAIRADSREEALAFLSASVQRLPDAERESVLSRALIVHDPNAWRRLVTSQQPLILVPTFDGADAVQAIRAGHTVMIALGKEGLAAGDVIELPRLRRSAARDALRAAGFTEERADDLATLARRSLLALRRKLAASPEVQQPHWARGAEARSLLPALLVGAWDENQQGDREAIATIAGRPYESVMEDITRLANESDPPVRQLGTTWFLSSKEDAWTLLGRYLTSDDLRRFEGVALAVLGAQDPALDLPAGQRWMAGVLGRPRPHSVHLRAGIADTLALIGSRGDRFPLAGGFTGQDYAARVVSQLLAQANADQTGRLWLSLTDVFPLLAEAAPDTFLDAVDAGLSGSSPILHLFTDAQQQSPLVSGSIHAGLLWALEGLAWPPDYLSRAAHLLARLVRLTTLDRRIGNRPEVSLREIFMLWHPQTAVPLDRRLGILDALLEREPEVAWDLLVGLLPQRQGIAHPTHAPRWRDWKPEDEPGVTMAELDRAIREVVQRLLVHVGTEGRRWKDLIKAVGNLPEDLQNAVIERLLVAEPALVNEADRDVLRDALRMVVSDNRRFPDATWAMPAGRVDRLAEAYRRFEPRNAVQRHAWLFTDHPKLPDLDGGDGVDHYLAIDNARATVVQEMHADGELSAIFNLAAAVDRPDEVGRALIRVPLPKTEEDSVLANLASADAARRRLALGYVGGRFAVQGWDWAEPVLQNEAPAWTPAQRADFLASLPASTRTLGWAERFDDETERAYWCICGPFGLEEPDGYQRAVTELVEHDRPDAAVDLLGLCTAGKLANFNPELVAHALESAANRLLDDNSDLSMLIHTVPELLDYLDASGQIDASRLARLEWRYLPLLRHSHRPARLLHRELAHDPEFFAEVMCWVFKALDEEKGSDEESGEISTEEQVRAVLGHQLLDTWRIVPGRRDDGSIDAEALLSWVKRARDVLATRGRGPIGDQYIGQILYHAGAGVDGIWPHPVVRDLIETILSEDLQTGLELAVVRSRGATVRGLTDGGGQERALVEHYEAHAQAINDRWPRTAAMLHRIARSFGALAEHEDVRAEITEDTWQ